ncbi:hypothetical protein [Thalassotalea sp. SU-HH00458]|uniref:hypothetical protein n=1 Tax=Thalassotalea sp. SU-HH00458 TaxID=3127657 RepID=UPI00310772C9
MSYFCHRIIGLILLLVCHLAVASTDQQIGFFLKSEFNDGDYINGIGSEYWLINPNSSVGLAINSSLGNAKVTDDLSIEHHYLAWDLGIKFGYFDDIFVYAELGFDFGEMVLSDRDKDEYDHNLTFSEFLTYLATDGYTQHHSYADYYQDYDSSNDIDGYIGSGVGVKFDQIVVEGFARYRQIDGEYWQADSQIYSGVKVTLLF